MKIIDITGTVLYENRLDNCSGMEVDLSQLPENLYFYKVSVNGRTSVGKLIKK